MNVLFLSQARQIEDQGSYHRAFMELHARGRIASYRNIPYLGVARERGWPQLWRDVIGHCSDMPTDLVFFQFYHGGGVESAAACVHQLRALKHVPLVAVSSGDLFSASAWVRPPPRPFAELSVAADVTFMTCMGSVAEFLRRQGARRLTLLPHGYPTDLFPPQPASPVNDVEFDVVMVASRGRILNPFMYTTWGALRRQRVADRLFRRYGKRFALFGHGWRGHPAWQGPVEYRKQIEAFRRGRVVVDGPPPFSQVYYASDRPFYVAGAGTPLVQFHTPRFEAIFKRDLHASYIDHDADTVKVCDSVLAIDEAELRRRVEQTVRLVMGRHTLVHRAETIIRACEGIQAGRSGPDAGKAVEVPLPLFHEDADECEERRSALVNWDVPA